MDVAGKTVFITGSTDGVGRYVALQLAAQGANLLIHGRDAARGKDVLDQINRGGKGKSTFYQADLSSLAEVRKLADRVSADHKSLDIFISNAGIGSRNMGPERRVSADGHELRFAVNYLPGFLLAYRLLPIIKAAAPSRIVNVASLGQAPLDFDDVMLTKDYQGVRAYSQSKLSQIMFTIDLAEELKGSAVTAQLTASGDLHEHNHGSRGRDDADRTVEEGGAAILHLATGDDMEGRSGLFFNGLKEARANAQAYDAAARERNCAS